MHETADYIDPFNCIEKINLECLQIFKDKTHFLFKTLAPAPDLLSFIFRTSCHLFNAILYFSTVFTLHEPLKPPVNLINKFF